MPRPQWYAAELEAEAGYFEGGLAKLYQSRGRPGETHAVLAPALEGFSPTPKMPEIAEAQARLSQLA